MNWEREKREDRITLTRSAFAHLLKDIIGSIAKPELDRGGVLDVLKSAFGISADLDFNPHFNEATWEHPLITRHNSEIGQAGILNAHFFTLYSKIADYEEHRYGKGEYAGIIPAHSEGYIQFVSGRIGNTYSVGRTYNIVADAPAAPVADPQLDLFGAEVSNG